MKSHIPIVLGMVFCVGICTGCRSFFGGTYADSVEEGFVSLADGDEMRERIASGLDLVLRYEFLTSAPFGGNGVLPARSDNDRRQVPERQRSFAGRGSYIREQGRWNFSEVSVRDGRLEVLINGVVVTIADKVTSDTRWIGCQGMEEYRNIRVKMLSNAKTDSKTDDLDRSHVVSDEAKAVHEVPPDGFEVCFNGVPEQLREMWKGVTPEGGYDSPLVRQEASVEERQAMQILADRKRDEHWRVRRGALCFDGFRGGYSLATKRDYGDFELWADWRLMSVGGEAGLCLRGCPKVLIRDAREQGGVGSGGLHLNRENPSVALVAADRPLGDWNRFHVIMRGEMVWVWLNGELVVNGVVLENCWDRSRRVFAAGQIELQGCGDPVEWRNVYIREL